MVGFCLAWLRSLRCLMNIRSITESSLCDIVFISFSLHCHISLLLCPVVGVIALHSVTFVALSRMALLSAEVVVGCSSHSDYHI